MVAQVSQAVQPSAHPTVHVSRYCEPAVILTVLTWRHHKNMGETCCPVLSVFQKTLRRFFFGHWKEVKTGSLKKEPSCICLVVLFFLSFFCFAVAIRLESSPDRLFHSETAGASYWLFGDRASKGSFGGGGAQMVQFSCHPVCLAETPGSKWRRIYSQPLNIYIHTHTVQMHPHIGSNAHTVTHVCVGSVHTHFSHLHWKLLLDTFIQRHFNRVQWYITLQHKKPKRNNIYKASSHINIPL